MSFFNELKRRNVLRVAIAYAVVAWLLLQVSDTLVPALRLPEWFSSGVALLLILGFPVALLFAWAFEMTPDGLKKERDIDQSQSIARVAGRKLDFVIIGLLVVALAYFGYDKFVLDAQRDAILLESAAQQNVDATPEFFQIDQPTESAQPSIAVLAFVNMSADSDNEYFSDGLSEELLNLLVKIPELKVAARTSSFSYKDKDVNIAKIGVELNVSHVLEGSVRKTGDRVRITAQLIKADDGFHIWSETFDRALDDIFVIQDEIAEAVVAELKIKLLGTLPEVRETDPEVYSLYLQASYFNNLEGTENREKALAALKQALAIDPDYAPAWVSLNYTYESQTLAEPARREEFRAPRIEAIERALAIDENLASAWAALAYQREYYDSDWDGARIAVEKALRLEPNNASVISAAAWVASSSGRLSEAIELNEKTVSLDPLTFYNQLELGRRYLQVGRIDDAFDAFHRVRTLNPDLPGLGLLFGRVYMLRGDLENALLETDKSPDEFFYPHQKATVLYMMGKETEAQTLLNELLETSADLAPGAIAVVYAWRGEGDSAFEWLERAYEQNELAPYTFLGSLFWRKLTGDPRYAAYVEKIGLLEEWKAMPPEYGGPPAQ